MNKVLGMLCMTISCHTFDHVSCFFRVEVETTLVFFLLFFNILYRLIRSGENAPKCLKVDNSPKDHHIIRPEFGMFSD